MHFEDFTVPTIDAETKMTKVSGNGKTVDGGKALMDADSTLRSVVRDASCNTDETRMNSASFVSVQS